MKEIPNSGMAVTVDIGNETSVHPAKKREVGERLSYWALGQTYGLPIQYRSPEYVSMEKTDSTIIVELNECRQGLHNGLGRTADIVGFEIAGADKEFHPAKAKLTGESKKIIVSSPEVKNPVAVRYCFRNYQPGYLYNEYGLPLAPFRTDDW